MAEFTPSPEQRKGLDLVKDWFFSRTYQKPRFILTGVAGSGKSSILQMITEELGLSPFDVAFVAYTGKASLVLNEKGLPATTIHRLIYIPYEIPDPDDPDKMIIKFMKRKYDDFPENIKLICVDEASMVPEEMSDDLERYGVPVLYVGDHFQLPPVKGDCIVFKEHDYRLTEIHRQAAGNPIIQVSKIIREGGNIPYGVMGNAFLKIRMDKLDHRQFLAADQILCGKNITRRTFNSLQRAKRGFVSQFPEVGDKVINLRNDWNIGIINGQIGKITHIHQIDEGKDRIMLDFLADDGTQFPHMICTLSTFTGNPPPNKPKWDGVKTQEMDFAETITVHKAQGSQWDKVIVLEECFTRYDEDHRKWLYTAVTRAASKLIVVTHVGKL